MKNLVVISLVFMAMVLHSFGQTRECMTVPMDSMRKANNPQLGTEDTFESWIAAKINASNARTKASHYRIPVVVHVVHNGEPIGEGANISYAQIQSQIEVLNEDFRRLEGTNGFNSHPDGADVEIEFYLVDLDPDGNALSEPGVDRRNGGREAWSAGISQSIENQLKPTTIWDPERYFNIWTVNFGGFIGRNLLGYAQFPDMSGLAGLNETGGSADTDGIVVGYHYFGSSEKGDFPALRPPYDLGRTATHEVGHWLGLRHIWGDGDCDFDDYVHDTPLAAEPTSGCPSVDFVTCTAPSMYENYMDYTNDACVNVFTQGQKQRMIAVLENSPRRPSNIEEEVLNVSSSQIQTISVYPNPTSQLLKLNITGTYSIQMIQITSISGQVMTNYSYDDPKQKGITKIHVDRLPAGVYLLALILSDGSKQTTRFVIK